MLPGLLLLPPVRLLLPALLPPPGRARPGRHAGRDPGAAARSRATSRRGGGMCGMGGAPPLARTLPEPARRPRDASFCFALKANSDTLCHLVPTR